MEQTQAVKPDPHVIVVFGATGDLSRRKLLPALYHLDLEGLMPDEFRVIGNGRSPMGQEEFRKLVLESIREHARTKVYEGHWKAFEKRFSYVGHDFSPDDPGPLTDAIVQAEEELGEGVRRMFYLSTPPKTFIKITEAIGKAGLQERARIVFEKPFGHDLESFTQLSNVVHSFLDESQVYRIDHFLGKETVQNILALRFANGMFEPIWNRHHIDHVQISVAEEIGIGTRAPFYEGTGALKDMLVTHLFQVLGFVAMEPPPVLEPRPLANEVLKLFESMKPLSSEEIVIGQYEGYLDEKGVDPASQTETYVAAKILIDNWRWAGVPFFLRTGKAMSQKRSSVTLAFRDPPRQMFKEAPVEWFEQDHLTLELGPDEGIHITFLAKVPGPRIELGPASMVFKYDSSFGSELIEAYERLILDALIGDRTLFTRGDGVERTWELVDEIMQRPPHLHTYPQGSWGPEAAADLIAPRHWHSPDEDRK